MYLCLLALFGPEWVIVLDGEGRVEVWPRSKVYPNE